MKHTIFSSNLPQQIESAIGSEHKADSRNRGAGNEHATGEFVLVGRVVKIGDDAVWRRKSWSVEVHWRRRRGPVAAADLTKGVRKYCKVEQQLRLETLKFQVRPLSARLRPEYVRKAQVSGRAKDQSYSHLFYFSEVKKKADKALCLRINYCFLCLKQPPPLVIADFLVCFLTLHHPQLSRGQGSHLEYMAILSVAGLPALRTPVRRRSPRKPWDRSLISAEGGKAWYIQNRLMRDKQGTITEI